MAPVACLQYNEYAEKGAVDGLRPSLHLSRSQSPRCCTNGAYLRTMCMYSGPVKHSRAFSSPELLSYIPVGLLPPAPYRSSRASSLSTL